MAWADLQKKVSNRGVPPDSFLKELVSWGKLAPEAAFTPRGSHDVYTSVAHNLGPFPTPAYRRAVMLEVMRVLGGFESSWHWGCGRDTNNASSNTALTTEAGTFQVSANSMGFGPELKALVKQRAGATDGTTFQKKMKTDHVLAMEYIARLLLRTVRHNGPVKRHEINPYLSREAVAEFERQLTT